MKSRPRRFKRTRTVLLFYSLLVAPYVLEAGLRMASCRTVSGDVWFVDGTLPKPHNEGGVAEVSISKSKGCILHMIHGK